MVTAVNSAGGSYPGGLGINPAGNFEAVELDALSYGRDKGAHFYFSVDEFAVGVPGPAFVGPDVHSEGAVGNKEASADVFQHIRAAGAPGFNRDVMDGDGVPPYGGWGTGLVEPNPPAPGPEDRGDNLDAVDMNTTQEDLKDFIFFSMDSRFRDPLEAALGTPPPNTGTAQGNFDITGASFVGGDVVVTRIGSSPLFLYAKAAQLGLDFGGGEPDFDDLDALALIDDGELGDNQVPFFDPRRDKIFFSVRRGSAVIGHLDSALGLRIVEGDILTVPDPSGVSPYPAIVVRAEELGLLAFRDDEVRSDELDALDLFSGLQPGDADQNYAFDFNDVFQVLARAKYMSGLAATWGDGDWNGGPGGAPGTPPPGNGLFDFDDIFAALATGLYETGPYAADFPGNSAVPAPSSMALACLALMGALGARVRRRRGE
jgi:hypothetical protein